MIEPIGPGGVVGILGGGQLGRMLAIAAAQLGLRAHIYCPEAEPPAGDVAFAVTEGGYDDEAALSAFARAVDVATFEFENVPAETVAVLARDANVAPGARALAVAQDRVVEKTFLNEAGAATVDFAEVDDLVGLLAGLERLGGPAILKTRRFGYDGKGQARLHGPEDAAAAWAAIGEAPAILEAFAPFRREISVIAARGWDGEIRAYDPGENVHEAGILRRTTAPAAAPGEAVAIAARILEALDYVGVIGVELFEAEDGALLVNEIAPRVHNTGHWTIEACATDQFQQHIRAICGWPLGDPARHSDAEMTNLIGAEAENWRALAASGAAVHLYGKGAARPGRKMGHLTRLTKRGD